MEPTDRELLKQVLTLAEENNRILHKMRRAALVSQIMSALYWVVIIGLSFGAYYAIQPYLDQLQGLYGGIKGTVENIQNIGNGLPNLGF
ncbi:MAG: Uncharacterized protein G01um101472_139 [Parcubacteria group bacterium Gr01-1014_72]|jgi:uncharacterized membrane protein|nr:MAG: Uncharacterized protein G01um101472_139 [Parcubacteria group bacterium Gr01-1014_72]